jgi:hypothetical protein
MTTSHRHKPPSDTRHIATKDLGLGPVDNDEHAVACAEAHAEVRRAPEQVRHGSSAGNVAAEPRHISHSLVRSNVRQRALVRVLKRVDGVDAAQRLLQRLDLLKHFVARLLAGRPLLLSRQVGELRLNLLRLGHLVEHARKEGAFLSSDLSSGGVVGDSAVTNGPHVLGTLDDKVLVDGEAAARVLLGGDLVDQVLDQRAKCVTSGPDQQTVGDALEDLLSIGADRLGLNVLLSDVLDHGLGADVDRLLLERLLGVVNQLLGEHGKDVGQGLDKRDVELGLDLGNPLLQVRVEEVLELTGKLDTCGATADDDHVQQTLDLLGRLVLERGRLAAVHDAVTDALGIADLLEEETVLLDTGNTKRGVLSTDTDNEHVKGDLGLADVALDGGLVVDEDLLVGVVDLGGLSLVVLDGGLLVAQEVADGLHDGAVLDGADGARGQQRGEEEVVAGRDDDDVVVLRVELLQQRDGAPAGTEDDERLLGWVGLRLLFGVAHLVDAIANVDEAGEGRELCEAPCPAQGAEASLLDLGGGAVSRRVAEGLAQDNLRLGRARRPLGAAGDERGARRESATAGQLGEVRSSDGPHVGRHWGWRWEAAGEVWCWSAIVVSGNF